MTDFDIVEWLRSEEQYDSRAGWAADEIERLRLRILELEKELKSWRFMKMPRSDGCITEVEQLRRKT